MRPIDRALRAWRRAELRFPPQVRRDPDELDIATGVWRRFLNGIGMVETCPHGVDLAQFCANCTVEPRHIQLFRRLEEALDRLDVPRQGISASDIDALHRGWNRLVAGRRLDPRQEVTIPHIVARVMIAEPRTGPGKRRRGSGRPR